MQKITVKSFGKINFSLNILGLLENGYHNLDMVMASIDIFDTTHIAMRSDRCIVVRSNAMEMDVHNSAYKAASLFLEKYNVNGVNIDIEKGIPIAGGLGGSSADAAGVLRGLQAMFHIDDREGIATIAKTAGSDVLYMLEGGFARVTGSGDTITPFSCDKDYHLVLVKPQKGVNTTLCFQRYDEIASPPLAIDNNALIGALQCGDMGDIIQNMGNALKKSAESILPEITRIEAILKSYKPLAVNMSGSGSTMYALVEDAVQAQKMAQDLQNRFYYCRAVRCMANGIELEG